VDSGGVGSPFQTGFPPPTLLGTSEEADTHQRMPITLTGATTGDVGCSEQDGMLPGMVNREG
jgi:hypothetical protein